MEGAARAVAAWSLRPAGSVDAAMVMDLVARGLNAPGFGLAVGVRTVMKFERGTVALSDAQKLKLETLSGGRLKILRTSMDGTVRWVGAARDAGSGNAAGKAIVETFMRALHARLTHLPGQAGNHYRNAPANLGFADGRTVQGAPSTPAALARADRGGTLTREADALGQAQITARALGLPGAEDIKFEVLTWPELRRTFGAAIAAYNNEAGHAYRGHHQVLHHETAPGYWEPAPASGMRRCL
jgi:hypothetical protein